jgi:hypothetical protein
MWHIQQITNDITKFVFIKNSKIYVLHKNINIKIKNNINSNINNINIRMSKLKDLKDLIDDSLTDKNTTHCYIEIYEKLFEKKKYDSNVILEIGIGDLYKKNGGSIKLWRDYFPNSTIYGLDIRDIRHVNDEIINKDRINLYTSTNAYDKNFIEKEFINKNIKFDILIDDGPHTLDSMIFFIKNYLPLLKEDGIFVIEDIPDINWVSKLQENVPEEYKNKCKVFDLREKKKRYDDILFCIM